MIFSINSSDPGGSSKSLLKGEVDHHPWWTGTAELPLPFTISKTRFYWLSTPPPSTAICFFWIHLTGLIEMDIRRSIVINQSITHHQANQHLDKPQSFTNLNGRIFPTLRLPGIQLQAIDQTATTKHVAPFSWIEASKMCVYHKTIDNYIYPNL